jgi:hypothetical protein
MYARKAAALIKPFVVLGKFRIFSPNLPIRSFAHTLSQYAHGCDIACLQQSLEKKNGGPKLAVLCASGGSELGGHVQEDLAAHRVVHRREGVAVTRAGAVLRVQRRVLVQQVVDACDSWQAQPPRQIFAMQQIESGL